MAKIIITIEDQGDKVKTISSPTFEEMIKLHAAGEGLQASHGYALCALNAIREAAREGTPFKSIINRMKGKL